MNDPLKDFVERHREDFDHLDAPEFNLEVLKTRLNIPKKDQKTVILSMNKWLVAASVLLVITTGVLIFRTMLTRNPNEKMVKTKVVQPKAPVPEKAIETGEQKLVSNAKKVENPLKKHKRSATRQKVTKLNLSDFYEKLNDSSSSSNRLAAVLEIDKAGLISENTINKLAKTLQYDGNSNVRLAALGVMEKYRDDKHVSALLVSALNNQQDPMVQLALVNLLGTMKNVKIDESLYALVSNPETFSAVKDEAYTILLKENKL